MRILQKFTITRAHHFSTAMCTRSAIRTGRCLQAGRPRSSNDYLPPARWRRTLVDPVPEQVQVNKARDHVELAVELADGLVVRVCQACVSLEPSDGVLHAHPDGVDQTIVLLLHCSQDPVVF